MRTVPNGTDDFASEVTSLIQPGVRFRGLSRTDPHWQQPDRENQNTETHVGQEEECALVCRAKFERKIENTRCIPPIELHGNSEVGLTHRRENCVIRFHIFRKLPQSTKNHGAPGDPLTRGHASL